MKEKGVRIVFQVPRLEGEGFRVRVICCSGYTDTVQPDSFQFMGGDDEVWSFDCKVYTLVRKSLTLANAPLDNISIYLRDDVKLPK